VWWARRNFCAPAFLYLPCWRTSTPQMYGETSGAFRIIHLLETLEGRAQYVTHLASHTGSAAKHCCMIRPLCAIGRRSGWRRAGWLLVTVVLVWCASLAKEIGITMVSPSVIKTWILVILSLAPAVLRWGELQSPEAALE